jgi:hypothetical protein
MASALSLWIQEAQLQNLVQQESAAREAGAHAQQEADEAAEQVISIRFLFIGQKSFIAGMNDFPAKSAAKNFFP